MMSPLSFAGKIGPLRYATLSAAVFFSQHLIALAALKATVARVTLDWQFFVVPLRSLLTPGWMPDAVLIAALAYGLLVAWALAALAFRRAADADVSEWIAAAAIVPIVQVPVILLLCIAPHRTRKESPLSGDAGDLGEAAGPRWPAAAQGLVAGVALTLFAVAVSTLVFGVYGYGLFVASPFVIGAVTAYFANRTADIGVGATMRLVTGATLLGAIGLVAVSLEGVVCIVLAAPIGVGVAMAGGALGRAIALSRRRSASQAVSSFALLPLVFALEYALPATTAFDTEQTMRVDARPETVWQAIVKMDTMDEPLALPFRLGVAYPLSGEVEGEGVGAVRLGAFSTGVAVERVTEWVPNRKLAFVVTRDVPAMREISPYEHVHAPHAVGYFRTTSTSFELLPGADGHTDIVERTSHQLRLDPVFYWLPMARWIVHENNARVLAHIRRQAERAAKREAGLGSTP